MYHPDKFLLACIPFAIASFECLIIYPASNESETEEDEVEKPPRKKSGPKKKCRQCLVRVSGGTKGMANHVGTCHPKKKFKCPVCSKVRFILKYQQNYEYIY